MNDNHTSISSVPLLDLQMQHDEVEAEISRAVSDVFRSQKFIMGDQVSEFEAAIAGYFGSRFAVGLASGTDALTLSLRAMDIGPGDEVIVPAFSFFATVECVLHVRATPVFVDVQDDSCCLDVEAVESLITPATKAIIPVHLFGHPADMAAIKDLATRYELKIIEDNAQAFGAKFGRKNDRVHR